MRRRLFLLPLLILAAGCAGRARVPDVRGTLPEVIAAIAWQGAAEQPVGAVLVDSVAFGQLAALAGERLDAAAWRAALPGRDVETTDAQGVLVCPDRAPCHVRGEATWLSVWDGSITDDRLTLVINRTWTVQRLYTMTESAAYRATLQRTGGQWRVLAVERLPV